MQTIERSQRPRGITIISIILWIIGVLGLIFAVLALIGLAASGSGGALTGAATVALVIAAILAVAEIILGWGLWTLRPWAFWATVVVEALNLLGGLYNLFAVHNGQGNGIFSIVVSLIILIYLFADRNVRAAFHTY